MKKKSFFKKSAVLLLLVCLIMSAMPVQAATKEKADKSLTTYVNKVIKNRKITSSTSKTAAMKRVFQYVEKCSYGRAPLGFKPASTKGWGVSFAKEMLRTKKGSCYHYAAALAFLMKKATDYPVRIGYGEGKVFSSKWQSHAWVEVKVGKTWYTFDANASKLSSLRKGKWYKQKRSSMMRKVYKNAKYINVEI